MERDKDLTQLFADYRPDLTEKAAFLEKLERKLDAVEYVKQVQERQIRHYKLVAVVAFMLGMVGAGILTAAFGEWESEATPLHLDTVLFSLTFLQEHLHEIIFLVSAVTISFLLFTLLPLLQDLFSPTEEKQRTSLQKNGYKT